MDHPKPRANRHEIRSPVFNEGHFFILTSLDKHVASLSLTYKLDYSLEDHLVTEHKPNFSRFLAFTPSLLWYHPYPSLKADSLGSTFSEVQATFIFFNPFIRFQTLVVKRSASQHLSCIFQF